MLDNFNEEYVDDFEEFLDQEIEEKAKTERGIFDIETANYYIGRIKKNENMIKMFENNAKSLITAYKDKVTIWKDKKINNLENDNERILDMLKDYYNRTAKDNKTKLRFVEGSIGFYKTRSKFETDDKAILEYLSSTFEDITPYTKTTIDVDKTKLKEAGKIDPVTGVFTLNNNVVPGVKVVLPGEKFKVN